MRVHSKTIKILNKIFHDKEAPDYNARHPEIFAETHRCHLILQGYANIKTHLRNRKKAIFLDIGSGTGFIPLILSEYLRRDDEVLCIDISSEMLKVEKEKLRKLDVGTSFILTDAESLPLTKEAVDFVTTNSVLHHLPEYDACLREIDRVLKHDGLVVILHEPNRQFYQHAFVIKVWNFLSFLAVTYRMLMKKLNRKYVIDTKLHKKVVSNLEGRGVIGKIKPNEVQQMVDIWSPTASGNVDYTKGFMHLNLVKKYFDGYKIIRVMTYNCPPAWIVEKYFLSKCLFYIFKMVTKNGNMFCIILKK